VLIVPALWLVCIGVVLLRPPTNGVHGSPAVGDDAPARLLRWAVGLLSEERAEWGQAMLGELAYLEGRGRRWRFAVACAASMLLPPWGRVTAPIVGTIAVAAGGASVYIATSEQFGWAGNYVMAAIVGVFLVGFSGAGIVLLRRPGVAVPGLIGGLVVAVLWLATTGYTFLDIVDGKTTSLLRLILMLIVPAMVGMAGSLWSGGAEVGKRVARLAAISAGLTTFLYGCIAVMVVGSGGGPGDPGSSLAATVSDRLGNNAIEFLLLMPTLTAVIGWAGAAAAVRLRPRMVNRASFSLATGGHLTQPRSRYLVLFAVAAGAVLLVGATFLAG
jgi:putative effector of murein hydrolase LrgA (UPF0299 family)